ncbi:protease complex subunit PrcB family protein [Chryseobacterium foetidum]|uniref:protease complex subunit PrcB family protein n=1 Tax=Chryseobacterium foetidum TaxID=2951057 RepID=UPI0021C602EB|nr:protease complex subunit PrcB family protein [Chryseobacterium foetidum]
MKKYLLILISALFIILNSCQDDEENVAVQTPVSFSLIGKGNFYGSTYVTPQNSVISSTTDWNNFLVQVNAQTNVSDSFTETNINFNQFMLIVVVDQVQNSGGHSIDIMTATESSQNITIDVEKLLNGNATTVITQPYHIVKIQKSTKPVIFN